MKVHTTNYKNTFIATAEDCPATTGEMPPLKGDAKTVAWMQFELLYEHPYTYTSDEVVFQVYAERNGIPKREWDEAREQFFSKGQPCLRASPLTKRYGWGVHSNADERVAIYGCETEEYKRLLEDPELKVVRAMRSAR